MGCDPEAIIAGAGNLFVCLHSHPERTVIHKAHMGAAERRSRAGPLPQYEWHT